MTVLFPESLTEVLIRVKTSAPIYGILQRAIQIQSRLLKDP